MGASDVWANIHSVSVMEVLFCGVVAGLSCEWERGDMLGIKGNILSDDFKFLAESKSPGPGLEI